MIIYNCLGGCDLFAVFSDSNTVLYCIYVLFCTTGVSHEFGLFYLDTSIAS